VKVYLLAETSTNRTQIYKFLNALGAPDWYSDAESSAAYLIEIAGRTCYMSFNKELNKNLTRIRNGNEDYIKNLINQGHESVLEHVSFTFGVIGVSRVLTHELVRHRVGTAYSQESLRYVWFNDRDLITSDETTKLAASAKKQYNEWYQDALDIYAQTKDVPYENLSFKDKKIATSLARRFVPMGIPTNLIFTANVRALRHIINMRMTEHAEAEIYEFAKALFDIIYERHPILLYGIPE